MIPRYYILNFLLAAVLIIVAGCKKNKNIVPIANLVIAGWTPQKPTPKDTITINGTGFAPNIAGNEILFENAYKGFITAASATEIKVIRETSGFLQLQDWSSGNTVTVKANSQSFTHPDRMYFRRPIHIIDAKGYFTGFRLFYPGDSISLEGTGFNSNPNNNKCILRTADGPAGEVMIARSDSSYYTKMVGFYPSSEAIGGTASTPLNEIVAGFIELTDNNSVVASLPCSLRVFPDPYIVFDSKEYSDSQNVLKLKVKVKSILPGTEGVFRNLQTDRYFTFTLAERYSDKEEIQTLQLQGDPLNPTEDIPPGTYRLSISRGSYNFVSTIIELQP